MLLPCSNPACTRANTLSGGQGSPAGHASGRGGYCVFALTPTRLPSRARLRHRLRPTGGSHTQAERHQRIALKLRIVHAAGHDDLAGTVNALSRDPRHIGALAGIVSRPRPGADGLRYPYSASSAANATCIESRGRPVCLREIQRADGCAVMVREDGFHGGTSGLLVPTLRVGTHVWDALRHAFSLLDDVTDIVLTGRGASQCAFHAERGNEGNAYR